MFSGNVLALTVDMSFCAGGGSEWASHPLYKCEGSETCERTDKPVEMTSAGAILSPFSMSPGIYEEASTDNCTSSAFNYNTASATFTATISIDFASEIGAAASAGVTGIGKVSIETALKTALGFTGTSTINFPSQSIPVPPNKRIVTRNSSTIKLGVGAKMEHEYRYIRTDAKSQYSWWGFTYDCPCKTNSCSELVQTTTTTASATKLGAKTDFVVTEYNITCPH